jgi:hypothetical protein
MLKLIEGLPRDVLAIEASGAVTHEDYLMFKPFFHGEVRLFGLDQLAAAKDWVSGRPERS